MVCELIRVEKSLVNLCVDFMVICGVLLGLWWLWNWLSRVVCCSLSDLMCLCILLCLIFCSSVLMVIGFFVVVVSIVRFFSGSVGVCRCCYSFEFFMVLIFVWLMILNGLSVLFLKLVVILISSGMMLRLLMGIVMWLLLVSMCMWLLRLMMCMEICVFEFIRFFSVWSVEVKD